MVEKTFYEYLLSLETARLQSYEKATQYYKGVGPFSLPKKLQKAISTRYPHLKGNYCDVIVNAMVSRLTATNVRCEDGSKAKFLQSVWRNNQMDAKNITNMRQAIKLGDSFVLVWPKADKSGSTITVLESDTCFPYYMDDDGTLASFKRQWIGFLPDTKPAAFKYIYYTNRVERYYLALSQKDIDTTTSLALATSANWLPYDLDGEAAVHSHPYGMPFVHFANKKEISPYGTSEQENMYGLQDAINIMLHVLARVGEFSGSKQGVLTGVSKTDFPNKDKDGNPYINLDVGDFLTFVDQEAKAYMLDQTSPDGVVTVIDGFIDNLAITSRTPRSVMDAPDSGTAASGFALAKMEAPLISKCTEAQVVFGAAYEQLFNLITQQSKLMGVEGANGLSDDSAYIEWAPLTDKSPSDKLAEAQTYNIYIDKKVLSTKAVQRELGYTEEEQKKINKEIADFDEDEMNRALMGAAHYENTQTSNDTPPKADTGEDGKGEGES